MASRSPRIPPMLIWLLSSILLAISQPFIDQGSQFKTYFGMLCAWSGFVAGATFLVPVARGTWPRSSQESLELFVHGTAYLFATVAFSTISFVMGYAGSYRSLSLSDPDSFNESLSSIDAIYFSLTTLTTVGYGDIFAQSQFARGLVSTQLIGTIAFAIVVVGILVNIVSKKPSET